ncbi:MAG TPA: nuclear transport factor 2 family protein, partial [Solirubrobacteraceae bacterium]|nr:nuclear transport factor 2 family protein [Solirubrobacteraceae bacterium]
TLTERDANVELARAAFDAFERRDMDAVWAIASDDVEVGGAPELPNAGPYRGQEGFVTWIAQWLEAWGEFRIEVIDIRAVDDQHVLVDVDQHGRGAGSGLEVTQRGLAYLVTVRGGVVTRLFLYPDRQAALAAAEDA